MTGREEEVAVIGGSEMHAKFCCISLKGWLWLAMLNLTGQDKSTTQRFKEEAESIGYSHTKPWITVEHTAEVSQVNLILVHGL